MKLLTILCALCALCGSSARAAERKPNFLFIYSDDHRWDAMGAVQREQGERGRFPWLASPGMDRLAAEGVRFRNAFVTLSLCAPSRAAFLTGRYNHANGITNNGTSFPADSVTHATLLRAAGYQTAYIGKWHMGNQRGQRPGFDYSASYVSHGRYQDCPFEINGTSEPTKGWVDDVAADFAIEFMQRNKERPFSVAVGFKSPHGPRGGNHLPERLRGLHADKTTRPVPNLRTLSPWQKPDAKTGEPPRGLADNAVHLDYLRHIAGVDENIGKLLAALDTLGLAEDTVVVYSSDNGYFLGEHCSGDKRSLYDESLRIPFLVRYPRLFGKGRTVDDMVLNIDLAPTFLDLARVPVPPEMQGASWKALAAGEKPATWRTSFFAEYYKELGEVPTCYALRTTTHKLVKYPNRPEWTEIFDLTADPYEIQNLAADTALTAKLDAELEQLMKTVNYTVPANANKPREAATPAEPPLEQLREKAQQGDAAAQAALAIRYRDGKGVTKDDAEAMQWAHRAADAGNADAMDFVGFAYLRGAVVKGNPGIAFGYFKAAAGESAQAAFNLGQCYFGAQGTEQDCVKALDWWKKAAAKGHGRAASTAAMALLSGEGVAPDAKEARRLAERAAELNDPSGLVFLGELQFQAGELDAAKANWTEAAKLQPTGLTGHPAQPSGNASAQQGADLLKLIEYRQRKSEPGKFAFVPMPHIHQGYNNCGSTACATFARFQGGKVGGWDFKKLCPSPLGTGTDWWHLLDASAKIGQKWKLVSYTPDDDGFAKATAMLKIELDAGRPVVVDFKYIGPQYPGGFAGHTLSVCGYIAAENLYILCNPAVATPGLQLITADDLKDFWRSDYYGSRANAVLSRPAFVIEKP